jgi:hypothetical protein
VHENGFVLFYRIFNEVVDSLCSGILGVKDDLILKVEPLEGKIYDSAALPVVGDLLASAVDNVGDLVGDDKLLVLGSEAVTDKEAIFNLDGSDHVLGKLHVHLLVHLLPHHVLLLVLEIILLSLLVGGWRRPHPHHFLLLLHHHLLLVLLFL